MRSKESLPPHHTLATISRDLIKFLTNFEFELRGLDETLLLEGELARLLSDCDGGGGLVAQFPGDEANTQPLHELLKVFTLSQLELSRAGRHYQLSLFTELRRQNLLSSSENVSHLSPDFSS